MTTGLLSDRDRQISSTLGMLAGNFAIISAYLSQMEFDPDRTDDGVMERVAKRVNEAADAYRDIGHHDPIMRIRWRADICQFVHYECALCPSPADPKLDDATGWSGLCRSCAMAEVGDVLEVREWLEAHP